MRLDERYITIIDDVEKKQKYLDDVLDIINTSYDSIGGAQSSSLNKLMDSDILWKLVMRNGKIVAVLISKLIRGTRKAVLGGTDGTPQGKKDLQAIVQEEVRQLDRHSWAEVSGAMEHIYTKHGATLISDKIATELMSILGKSITPTGDGYHYTRKLGPNKEEHQKVLVGNEDQLKSFIDVMKSAQLSESRDIVLAKNLLESKGYIVSEKK